MEKDKKAFIKTVVFVTGILYLLFVLFTIIFSGSWHALFSGSGLFLEYAVIFGVVGFCAGLGWLIAGRPFDRLRTQPFGVPIIIMGASIVVLLGSFYIYWRNFDGIVALFIVPVIVAVQVLMTHKITG